jgi:hypothetical protein
MDVHTSVEGATVVMLAGGSPVSIYRMVRDHGFLIDLSRVSGELWKGFLTRGRGFEPRIQDEIQSRKRSWTTLPRKIRRGEVK